MLTTVPSEAAFPDRFQYMEDVCDGETVPYAFEPATELTLQENAFQEGGCSWETDEFETQPYTSLEGADGFSSTHVPKEETLQGTQPAQADTTDPPGEEVIDVESERPVKRMRPSGGDLPSFFRAAAAAAKEKAATAPKQSVPEISESGADTSDGKRTVGSALDAFQLRRSRWPEFAAELDDKEKQDAAMRDVELVLTASVPLLPSGRAIFSQLPSEWLDFTARNDALGTRCLFASRRHEHSVFAALQPDQLLSIPDEMLQWRQPPLQVCGISPEDASLADEDPWTVEVHPADAQVRVMLRPRALLLRMLRRGTALPSAAFTWRAIDTSVPERRRKQGPGGGIKRTVPVGEFSILSNVEDAACKQPPNFLDFPLRIEQLRSLGWMLSQEQKRHEPFVTELREQAAFADAPHWRLEGSLRCEYRDVKGGVLADAIGYGKTACTIGLIDSTSSFPLPQVPAPFAGFIPTRATLVLAPTNLHTQWLAEITKFTQTSLKVLSVPTCAQLKRLTPRDFMEADVVVATYRLFYSTPYLRRMEELAQQRQPSFAFPRLPTDKAGPASRGSGASAARLTAEWAKAYRTAFELLPGWAAMIDGRNEEQPPTPVTPARGAARATASEDTTPAATVAAVSRIQTNSRVPEAAKEPVVEDGRQGEDSICTQAAKRRRLLGKQSMGSQLTQSTPPPVEPSENALEKAPPSWASETQYVPLEAFWWRRVVCDEFHELLSRYPPAQVAVELFHSDYKWGLSGTPPCQTLAQLRSAARFFGVQIPCADSQDAEAEVPRQVAQEWLDAFVRRNTSELPPLDEEERIIPVHQTSKERALYLALTHQQEALLGSSSGIVEPPEFQAARHSASGLLKLCSHFCQSGASEALTAADECELQLASRKEQARLAERRLHSAAERALTMLQSVRHFEPHFCSALDQKKYQYIFNESKAALAARLRFLGTSHTGTKAELVHRFFQALRDASEDAKEQALRVDFKPKSAGQAADFPESDPPAWTHIEDLWRQSKTKKDIGAAGRLLVETLNGILAAQQVGAGTTKGKATSSTGGAPVPGRCIRLRSQLGMPKVPAAGATPQEARELRENSMEWLQQRGNGDRLRHAISAWKVDIQTNASKLRELSEDCISKCEQLKGFQTSLRASQEMPGCADEVSTSHFAKYGSKIEALVRHVQKLQKEDSGCKLICFVQWEDLKRKISSALEEFGVQHITLQGSVWARRAALMKFQYQKDSLRMLLLSLQESASGTNLTAANHVIIVHPMEAASREEAVAFEMQAVGRVRRPGQTRKIHIWRFVTMDTIEQRLTEEHQKELWERQRAKVLVSQLSSFIGGESDEEAGDEPAAEVINWTLPPGRGTSCKTKLLTSQHLETQAQDQATQIYLAQPDALSAPQNEMEDEEEQETLRYEVPSAQTASPRLQAEQQNAEMLDLATQCYIGQPGFPAMRSTNDEETLRFGSSVGEPSDATSLQANMPDRLFEGSVFVQCSTNEPIADMRSNAPSRHLQDSEATQLY